MSRLVSQILDISRLDGGRLVLDREDRRPRGAGPGDRRRRCRRRRVATRCWCGRQPTLPARVDPLRLEQVVTNLLDNAIKYSPEGGQIEVELASRRPGWRGCAWRITGSASHPSGDSTSSSASTRRTRATTHPGMGLGLYISRQIVELHGGSIQPEFPPTAGRGSSSTCRRALTAWGGRPEEGNEPRDPGSAHPGRRGRREHQGPGRRHACRARATRS